ncbi:hypothetical protein Q9Q99_04320 [Curtobacterium flaccumfaciens]|nr:hypothetical protein Q9Q99_04320 [Curtobacterium flaccumfaciens]
MLQRGSTVYSVDETKGTVAQVNVADATVGDAITLPAGTPHVFFAGDTAVIGNADTGELWATPASDLAEFDASAKADLTLGADTVFDASDGHVAVYSAKTGTASLVDVGTTLTVDQRWKVKMDRGDDFQVATFDGHLAVLDRTSGALSVDGRTVELGDRVGSSPALQRSSDTTAQVTVAGTAGLVRVSASGAVDATALQVSGRAARPYVDGSCTYAAWAGGQAIDTCDGNAAAAGEHRRHERTADPAQRRHRRRQRPDERPFLGHRPERSAHRQLGRPDQAGRPAATGAGLRRRPRGRQGPEAAGRGRRRTGRSSGTHHEPPGPAQRLRPER